METPSTNPAPAATPPVEPTAPTSPMLSSATVPPSIDEAVKPTAPPAATVPEVIPTPVPAKPTGQTDLADLGFDTSSPTNLAILTYIRDIATSTGLDVTRALGHSLNSNNPDFVDLAYIKDVLKDAGKSDNVANMLKGLVSTRAEATAKLVTDVYAQAGGEANWKVAVTHFNKSADPAQRAAVKAMLNSNDPEVVKYAVNQVVSSAKEAGVTVQHVPHLMGQNTTERGITRAEFTKRITARGVTDAEYNEARRLRAIGMKNNI